MTSRPIDRFRCRCLRLVRRQVLVSFRCHVPIAFGVGFTFTDCSFHLIGRRVIRGNRLVGGVDKGRGRLGEPRARAWTLPRRLEQQCARSGWRTRSLSARRKTAGTRLNRKRSGSDECGHGISNTSPTCARYSSSRKEERSPHEVHRSVSSSFASHPSTTNAQGTDGGWCSCFALVQVRCSCTCNHTPRFPSSGSHWVRWAATVRSKPFASLVRTPWVSSGSIPRPSVGDPFSPAPSAAGWVRLIHSWGAFGSGSPPNRTSSLRPTNRSGLFRSTVSRSSGPFVRETGTKPRRTWRTAAAVARRGSWRTSQRPSSTCTTSEARAWRPSRRAEGWCRAQHRARAEQARRRSHVPAEPRSPWRKKPLRTRPRRPQHLRTTKDSRTRGSRSSWTSSTSSSKLVTKSQETSCASTTVAPTWTSAPSPPHSCRRTKSALARSQGCVSKHGRKRSKRSRFHAMRRKTHVEGWRATRDGEGVERWTVKLT